MMTRMMAKGAICISTSAPPARAAGGLGIGGGYEIHV